MTVRRAIVLSSVLCALISACLAEPSDPRPHIETGHWSFNEIRRRPLPRVNDGAWVRNIVDPFVLAKLEAEGLAPSPEADPATLLRRVTLDLTGLPPSVAELDAYLSDRTPEAYERVVDRLLASPRCAEHLARDWLDAARYADSLGLQVDQPSTMWAYREWVIDAFATDMPFDRFTLEQLAGDLLPDATDAQRIASGFNRNHPITVEGGVVDEEYRQIYAIDRASTVSTVWLGLTFGCARCHDHKYDPLPQADFYAFVDCFNHVPDSGLGANNRFAPTVKVAGPVQTRAIAELETRRSELTAAVDARAHDADAAAWYAGAATAPVRWTEGRLLGAVAASGADVTELGQGVIEVSTLARVETVELELEVPAGGEGLRAVRLDFLDDDQLPDGGPGRGEGGELSITHLEVWDITTERKSVALIDARANDEDEDKAAYRAIDGRGATAWGPKERGVPASLIAGFAEALGAGAESVKLRVHVVEDEGFNRTAKKLRVRFSGHPLALFDADARLPGAPSAPGGTTSAEERRGHYLRHFASGGVRDAARELLSVERRLAEQRELATTMVMGEDSGRTTNVASRGNYDQPGERVTCDVPLALPALPADLGKDRAGIARWLTGPSNPLTPRVIADHYFALMFGEGLVRTPDDFGARGEPPTHPELLDTLAAELRESGWKLKPFLRLLVRSAAYRQSSRAGAALEERDPGNRLLGHANEVPLPAEVLRDQALAVSGLLVERIGGPSVFPYHPIGLWEELNDSNGGVLNYRIDRGPGLYRRSMYSFWKRTLPNPAMTVFDAPSRELTVVRRARSQTPLQPLVLLHDPQLIEAARKLAERMRASTAGGPGLDSQLRFGFRSVTARQPQEEELAVLRRLYEDELAELAVDPQRARLVLEVGAADYLASPPLAEQAALAQVARVLLNLKETVTRE